MLHTGCTCAGASTRASEREIETDSHRFLTHLPCCVFVLSVCVKSSAGGVDVCLSCFNGGCTGADSANHGAHHAQLCHPIVLNIKKRDIIKPEAQEDASMAGEPSAPAASGAAAAASASSSAASSSGSGSEPASKVTKLAIGVVGGVEVSDEPTFFYETQARCLECKINLEPAEHEPLRTCVAAILEAQSASRPTEVAWVRPLMHSDPNSGSSHSHPRAMPS